MNESAASKAPRPATRRTLYFLICVQVVLMMALLVGVVKLNAAQDDARESTLAVRDGCERDNQVRRGILKFVQEYGNAKMVEDLRQQLLVSPAIGGPGGYLTNCSVAYPLP